MIMDLVSVVIPTYRRSALVQQAVKSVLAQTYKTLEVLVVIDGVDADGTRGVIDALNDSRTHVIETGINGGPAKARYFGVRHANGIYVALLDDDDEWTANKLEHQMLLLQQHCLGDREFLLSCRSILRINRTDETHTWPVNLYRMGDDLSEYLLDRRYPFKRSGLVASGTLLFPRSLALRVPFPNDAVHEDWSWLLVCVMRDRIPLIMCEDPMFIYNIDLLPSRNTLMNWHKSLEWGLTYRNYMSGRAFAGLLSSTTAWRAKRQDGVRAFPEIARTMREEGRPSVMHWLTLIAVMVFPLAFAEKLRQFPFSQKKKPIVKNIAQPVD
jgi:glycosyltransferase involved in cell wall biosynthesis